MTRDVSVSVASRDLWRIEERIIVSQLTVDAVAKLHVACGILFKILLTYGKISDT